jgi:adenylate cyclase
LSHQIDEALQSGVTPDQLGGALAHIARTVLPAVGSLLQLDHRRVLEQLINTEVVEAASRDWGRDTIDMAVGFVDLVGFTRLSAATDPDGLGTVLTAFEKLATEAAKDVGDVLLAKTIGDAVMLVSGHPDQLARVLTRVVLEEPAGLQDVGRRAGMAAGEVVVREGDYVGTTVNVAARLTDLARPASVVVSSETVERLDPDRWQTSKLPPVRLKGLGHARPLRIRPAEADERVADQ